MRIKLRLNCFCGLLLCVSQFSNAQNFSVKASLDSSLLFIGEQACLSFEVHQPKNLKVHVPLFSDSIVSGIELVERKNPDTIQRTNDQLTIVHSYMITSFDTALYYIPSFPFADEYGDTVESNPLSMKVFTVDIDTAQFQAADIKPIYEPPFDWAGFFLIVLYVVLALVGAFGIYLVIRKFVKKEPILKPANKEPEKAAHLIAFEALERIRNEKIWQKGQVKVYYTELTEVIRTYISRRYDVNAMESTSDEIIDLLKLQSVDKTAMKELRSLLQLSDLVKFAKYQPLPDEFTKSFLEAYSFVDETKEMLVEDEKNDEGEERAESVENKES